MKRALSIILLSLLVLGLSACGSGEKEVSTDNYPNKTIQLIVPWDAGGDTDAINRIIAEELEEELEQNVIVKNIAGASGVIGAQEALNAENDGYTLLAIHDSVAMSKLTGQASFGYSDFEPVSLMTSTHHAVATSTDSPWNTMEELVKDAKERPEEITFAASIGSISQLEPAFIETAANIKFNIVGYDGTAERMKAVVGNDVDLGVVSVIAGKDYLADDRMKLLGYTGSERNPELPDVPTLTEQGINVVSAANRGIFAPKDTPEEVIEKLNNALENVANSESFIERIESMGNEVNFISTAEYRAFLEKNEEDMIEALEETGLIE